MAAVAKYVQKGDNIDYAAAANVAYMEVVPLKSRIGVSVETIAAGDVGPVTLTGVYEIPADAATEIAVGEQVYFNTETNCIDKTAAMIPAGIAVAAKAKADTVAIVRIG